MKRLAIIGTAGRGDDRQKLNFTLWYRMLAIARDFVEDFQPDELVSGGAAWGDHVAVALHLENPALPLVLHLPGVAADQQVALKYHRTFEYLAGIPSIHQIQDLARDPKCWLEVAGGFKERNCRVAHDGTHFLAFTFGKEGIPKDGGTRHTIQTMLDLGKNGWHVDLHTLERFALSPF